MSYSIKPSDDGRYILTKVCEDTTRAQSMQYNLEAHALGRELGIRAFLVDLTESRNIETMADNYSFAYEDMQKTPGIDRGVRVAILVSPDDHTHDFIETVARNAGLDVKLYRDRQQALDHLYQFTP